MIKYQEDISLLILTHSVKDVNKAIIQYPALKSKLISFSVPNDEVYKYLNAADFGILFRENTVMNNVASPTKFAEYMLCGLPVIISEGVGDYSYYTLEKEVGIILNESDLMNPRNIDFIRLLITRFDKNRIAELGKQEFSKQSIVNNLIEHFKA